MKTIKNLPSLILGMWLFAAVALTGLSGCNEAERKALKAENEQLKNQLAQTETTVNDLLQTFNEVENNLTSIKEKEGMISMESENAEMTADRKSRILSDIQAINTLMDENRKKISGLQEQLSKSGLKIANFEKKMKTLLAQLDEKEKDIAKLKDELTTKDFQIASLNSRVDTLATQVEEQASQIIAQTARITDMDKQLNTYYFTEGTYQELKEKGVIEKEGWTPWTGKIIEVNENAGKENFTEIDKRETKSIPINARKAVIISEHPEGTYEFEKNEEGLIASLEITNPDEFWRMSRYLVVEVK
ncbi:MAG TPA: hypothetical protein VNJ07_09615 [Chitinophagales bacterium]|nr:hypothetical protein [Chitinophagales bacterium]